MVKTNFKNDIRWLTPKIRLLLHPRGHLRVKFHEFIIIQLLGEIANWFWAQKVWKTQVSINTLRAGVRYIRTWISGLKISSFRLPYQRPSSSADCARELLNGSNGSPSLVDYIRKKLFLVGVCGFFVTHVISEVVLGSFWHMLPGLGPNR